MSAVITPTSENVIFCRERNIKLSQAQLVKQFEPLAHKMVREYRHASDPDYHDYLQEAFIVLMRCYDKLTTRSEKPILTSEFINYAAKSIANQICTIYRRNQRSVQTISTSLITSEDVDDALDESFEDLLINEQCAKFVSTQIDLYAEFFKERNMEITKQYLLADQPVRELAESHNLSEIAIYKTVYQTLEDVRDVFRACDINAEDLL
jgi:RNA polymerase sigma factor (sigma-70 family)